MSTETRSDPLAKQPFGFSWTDVDALRYLKGTIDGQHPGGLRAMRTIEGICERIAALLPPREGET